MLVSSVHFTVYTVRSFLDSSSFENNLSFGENVEKITLYRVTSNNLFVSLFLRDFYLFTNSERDTVDLV